MCSIQLDGDRLTVRHGAGVTGSWRSGCKQAVVKCTGEGLRRALRSFVVDATASPTQVLDAAGRPLNLHAYAVAYPGHVAAVGVADTGAPAPRNR